MEVLIFIALVIIVFLLRGLRSAQKNDVEQTRKYFQIIRQEIKDLKEVGPALPSKEPPLKATDEAVVQWRPNIPVPEPPVPKKMEPIFSQTPVAPTEKTVEAITPESKKTIPAPHTASCNN